MIKVLDLFAGTQSVRKALDAMGVEYEYKGIDIYSPEDQNIIIDLTSDFALEMVLDRLGDWKPDFIWASPICNKFSVVLSGAGGNYYFEKTEDGSIKPRENWDIKVQPHMAKYQNKEGWNKARKNAELSLKMFNNTKKIINHYDTNFAIENPATALSRYILQEYKRNVAHYCMYGFDYKKPTAIYTNKTISLRQCDKTHVHASLVGGKGKPKPTHWDKNVSTYANRSSVPPELIKDIIKQLTKGVNNENN